VHVGKPATLDVSLTCPAATPPEKVPSMCTVSDEVVPKASVVVPENSPDVMSRLLKRNVGVMSFGVPLHVSS
jgi:hypothetical protein